MMRYRCGIATLLWLLAVGLTLRAEAIPMFFTDRASFNAAVSGTLIEERFEASFSSTSMVQFNGFKVSATVGNLVSTTSAGFVSEGLRSLTDDNPFTDFVFAFDVPTLAFGMDINDIGELSGQVTISSNTGSFTNHVIYSAPPFLPSGSRLFFGVIDDAPFVQLTLDKVTFDRLGFDFAVIQAQAVPEPTSVLLLGSGIAGLLWLRKHYRKS
jgi:hypothetical protein